MLARAAVPLLAWAVWLGVQVVELGAGGGAWGAAGVITSTVNIIIHTKIAFVVKLSAPHTIYI